MRSARCGASWASRTSCIPRRRGASARACGDRSFALPSFDASVRAVGINHVALEVGDLEAAIDFYRGVFGFPEPEREPGMAFLDMGDQFLALSDGRASGADSDRHFGLVVDDKAAARELLS